MVRCMSDYNQSTNVTVRLVNPSGQWTGFQFEAKTVVENWNAAPEELVKEFTLARIIEDWKAVSQLAHVLRGDTRVEAAKACLTSIQAWRDRHLPGWVVKRTGSTYACYPHPEWGKESVMTPEQSKQWEKATTREAMSVITPPKDYAHKCKFRVADKSVKPKTLERVAGVLARLSPEERKKLLASIK